MRAPLHHKNAHAGQLYSNGISMAPKQSRWPFNTESPRMVWRGKLYLTRGLGLQGDAGDGIGASGARRRSHHLRRGPGSPGVQAEAVRFWLLQAGNSSFWRLFDRAESRHRRMPCKLNGIRRARLTVMTRFSGSAARTALARHTFGLAPTGVLMMRQGAVLAAVLKIWS